MKRFIVRVTIFILPIFLIAYGADVFLSGNLKQINKYKEGEFSVWNDLYSGKINSDIVIYGSSRAWLHVNSPMMQDSLKINTYNLGINSHNFWLEHFRHYLLLKYNKKPALIIHTLGMATIEKRIDLSNSDQFLPYMFYNKDMENAIISYKGFTDADFKIPLLRYYGKKDAILSAVAYSVNPSNNPAKRVLGYEPISDLSWHDDLAKAKRKMKSYHVKIDTTTINLFEEYLADCKAKGIKVLLLYTPEWIEGQLFTDNREEVMNIFRRFSTKFGIPLFDYSNDPISFQKKYFSNSEHLNKLGADFFTEKLIDTLRRSGLVNEITHSAGK